jgi:hypothetical protein
LTWHEKFACEACYTFFYKYKRSSIAKRWLLPWTMMVPHPCVVALRFSHRWGRLVPVVRCERPSSRTSQ